MVEISQDVDTAVEVINDVLMLLDPDVRLRVAEALVDRQVKAMAEPKFKFMALDDIHWTVSDETRWREKMLFKSLVVQVLVRTITNNHSPEDAARILFREHRDGMGSGWLPDYLDGLPAIAVALPADPDALTARQRARIALSLHAFDGRCAGLSYREIAMDLFGESRVPSGRAWRNHPLRSRTIRLCRRGACLVNGGYLDLLCPPRPTRESEDAGGAHHPPIPSSSRSGLDR